MNIPTEKVPQDIFDKIPTVTFEEAKKTKLREYKYICSTGQWLYHREGCVYVLEVGEPVPEGKQPLQKVPLNSLHFPKHWDRKTKRKYIRVCERCQKKGITSNDPEFFEALKKAGFNQTVKQKEQ